MQAKAISGYGSYAELGFFCFGRYGIFLVNFAISLSTAFLPIAYFMIFGHIAVPMVSRWEWARDTVIAEKYFLIILLATPLGYFVLKKEI